MLQIITPTNIQILLYLYIYFLTSFDQNVKVNLGRNILGIFNLKRDGMVAHGYYSHPDGNSTSHNFIKF